VKLSKFEDLLHILRYKSSFWAHFGNLLKDSPWRISDDYAPSGRIELVTTWNQHSA
jgi:hypothetical protein